MAETSMGIFKKDSDYLEYVRDKLGLRSKAIALKLIVKRIKELTKNAKLEDELR